MNRGSAMAKGRNYVTGLCVVWVQRLIRESQELGHTNGWPRCAQSPGAGLFPVAARARRSPAAAPGVGCRLARARR